MTSRRRLAKNNAVNQWYNQMIQRKSRVTPAHARLSSRDTHHVTPTSLLLKHCPTYLEVDPETNQRCWLNSTLKVEPCDVNGTGWQSFPAGSIGELLIFSLFQFARNETLEMCRRHLPMKDTRKLLETMSIINHQPKYSGCTTNAGRQPMARHKTKATDQKTNES